MSDRYHNRNGPFFRGRGGRLARLPSKMVLERGFHKED
jgi:hypothetical protein